MMLRDKTSIDEIHDYRGTNSVNKVEGDKISMEPINGNQAF